MLTSPAICWQSMRTIYKKHPAREQTPDPQAYSIVSARDRLLSDLYGHGGWGTDVAIRVAPLSGSEKAPESPPMKKRRSATTTTRQALLDSSDDEVICLNIRILFSICIYT